ncbi:unnamed protein product, partial [Symbiodinium sp. CCMP2456]
ASAPRNKASSWHPFYVTPCAASLAAARRMRSDAEEPSDDERGRTPTRAETPLAPEDSTPHSPEAADATVDQPDAVDAGEDEEDGDGKRRKDTPEGLVWVVLQNSKAPEKFRCVKALIPKELSVTDIRRATSSKVGCPFKELQLQIDGEHMWAGRLQPFLNAEDREYKVKWRKINRLAKYIEHK